MSEVTGPTEVNNPVNPAEESRGWTLHFLLAILAGALLAVLVFAWSLPPGQHLFGFALMFVSTSAALTLGGFTGFLFAFPRYETSGTTSTGYQPNTNLQQISDWLTKILVGLGLVQAGNIARGFNVVITEISQGVNGTHAYRAFAGALLLYALVPGFIIGYVQARIALPRWFKAGDADEVAQLNNRVQAVEQQTQADEDKGKKDAHAREVFSQALVSNEPVDQAGLTSALTPSSDGVRAEAFDQAATMRRQQALALRMAAATPSAATTAETPDTLIRLIPLFEALYAARAPLGQEFRSLSQIGYIHRDLAEASREPVEFERAVEALNRAISDRDDRAVTGWRVYELTRAECRAAAEQLHHTTTASTPEVVEAVLNDLQASRTLADWRAHVDRGLLHEWITLNGAQSRLGI